MANPISMLTQRLRGGDSFAGNVALLAGGTALAQGLTLLSKPVLTRLYTPEDIGILGIFGSMLSLIAVVGSLCYERAIPLPAGDDEAANVLSLSLATVFLMALATGGIVFFCRDGLARFFDAEALAPYFWLLPIGLVGAGSYQALSFWATRKRHYGQIAQTKVVQSIGLVATQIGFGLAKFGPIGLLFGDVLGRAAGSGTFAHRAWKLDRGALANVSISKMHHAAKRFRNFPLVSSWAALLHTAATAVPPLLFAALYSSKVSGWYALGQQVVWMPMALVGQSVAQVFMGQASALVRDRRAELLRLFDGTARRLLWLGLPPILVVVAFGGALFRWVFGPEWTEAGVYLQIIGITQLAQFVVGPVFPVLNVLERQRALLACDAVGFALIVGGIAVVHAQGGSARMAMAAYGIGTVIMYGLLWVVSRAAIRGSAGDAS